MNKILVLLTHGGLCHADEIFAISMIIAKESQNYAKIIVSRTGCNIPQDYRDSSLYEVWVIDCGGIYNPKEHKFDHHNICTSDCSFSQIARYYNLHDDFDKYFPWYDRIIVSDNYGTAKWFKKQKEVIKATTALALNNPFESFIRSIFGSVVFIEQGGKNDEIFSILLKFGKYLINSLNTRKEEEKLISEKFKVVDKVGYINCKKVINTLIYYGKQAHVEVILTTGDSGRSENKGCLSVLSVNSSRINLNNIDLSNIGKINFIHRQGHLAVINPNRDIDDEFLKNIAEGLNIQIKKILSENKQRTEMLEREVKSIQQKTK